LSHIKKEKRKEKLIVFFSVVYHSLPEREYKFFQKYFVAEMEKKLKK